METRVVENLCCHRLCQFRVGVTHFGEIRSSRLGIEPCEHLVVAVLALGDRYPARWIVDIAEDNGARGARLLACGANRTVCNDPVMLSSRFDARVVDTLDAVRALLHDPTVTDGDVRVALQLQELVCFRVVAVVRKEVETTYFVRAVVRAVTCTDAA